MAEIKVELRDMCNTISQHHSDESTRLLDKKLDAQDTRIKREMRGKFEEFDRQMDVVTKYCKRQITKITTDFENDIKSVQKLRSRDRSDYDVILAKQQEQI